MQYMCGLGRPRDERVCKMCDEGEVEGVEHFILHCMGKAEERKEMVKLMNEIYGGVARDGR